MAKPTQAPRPKPIHPKPGPSTGSPKPGPKTKSGQAAGGRNVEALAELDTVSEGLQISAADYARRVNRLANEVFGRRRSNTQSKAGRSVEHGNLPVVDPLSSRAPGNRAPG